MLKMFRKVGSMLEASTVARLHEHEEVEAHSPLARLKVSLRFGFLVKQAGSERCPSDKKAFLKGRRK